MSNLSALCRAVTEHQDHLRENVNTRGKAREALFEQPAIPRLRRGPCPAWLLVAASATPMLVGALSVGGFLLWGSQPAAPGGPAVAASDWASTTKSTKPSVGGTACNRAKNLAEGGRSCSAARAALAKCTGPKAEDARVFVHVQCKPEQSGRPRFQADGGEPESQDPAIHDFYRFRRIF